MAFENQRPAGLTLEGSLDGALVAVRIDEERRHEYHGHGGQHQRARDAESPTNDSHAWEESRYSPSRVGRARSLAVESI